MEDFFRVADRYEKLPKFCLKAMGSSILREIAELSNPHHVDYDPEDIAPDYQDSDSDQDEDPTSGREHYVQVR